MLRVVRPSSGRLHVDLKTVRETLVYMEGDCKSCPGLEGVAAALEQTINEIDRVNATAQGEQPATVISARFIPAGL